MTFETPMWILIAVLAAAALVWWNRRKRATGAVRFPTLEDFPGAGKAPLKVRLHSRLFWLRAAAIVLTGLALARPRTGLEETRVEGEGIDIVLAVDVSTSMLAEDFTLNGKRTNRLDVIKAVLREFILGRRFDRIGAVAFAGRPYTLCPLTMDYGVLLQFIDRARIGMLEDGTGIGSAIVTALNRLKKSQAKTKIIILLTDGRNNAGNVDPMTAADLAARAGVKIYTIGAGTKGPVPYPAKDIFGNEGYQWLEIDIDDTALRQIADRTLGRYFHATDTRSLEEIYKTIDRLEKTRQESAGYTDFKERFGLFLWPALFLFLIEATLSRSWLATLP